MTAWTLAFVAVDLGLLALAWRRPWLGLGLLLAGLPFGGLLTSVIPRVLALGTIDQLVLAAWRDAVLLGIVAAAAVSWFRSGPRRAGFLDALVGTVLLLGLVYVIVSPQALTGAYAYRVLYEPPLLFWAVVTLRRTTGMPDWVSHRVPLAFTVGVTVAALYTWVQVYVLGFRYLQVFYTDPGERIHHSYLAQGISQPRGIGTLTSPNEFGAVLAIAIVLLAVPGLLRLRPAIRALMLAALGFALLLSFSRSGMLAAGVGLVAVAWLSRDRIPRLHHVLQPRARGRALAWAAPLVAVAIVLGGLVFASSGAARLLQATTSGTDPSAANRPASARAGLMVLAERPLGLGLGTAGPKAVRFEENAGRPRILTETWYLLYAIQVGVVGAALLAGLVLLVLRRAWASRDRPIARATLGIGLGLGVGALFIPIIEEPSVFIPLWAIAGLAVAGPAGRAAAAVPEGGPRGSRSPASAG